MLGLVKPISVGICGDAKAAAAALVARLQGKTLACSANKAERAAKIEAEKARVGERARRVDARDRRLVARDLEGLGAHAPAADAARARARDAEGRDGLDRHRQHLLGVELLPALRASRARCSRR